VHNGQVWPAIARDEHWEPIGRYDAADGWPPPNAKPILWWVRPGDRHVSEGVGVSRQDESSVVVDFRWRWQMNAVGTALGKGLLWMDDTYQARAILRLFDDGWRVDRVELGERR